MIASLTSPLPEEFCDKSRKMASDLSKPKHVKVTYFNCRARGEAIRLILTYGGIKFEDERIDMPNVSDQWERMKASE